MSGNLPNTDDVLLQVPDVRCLRSAAETDHPPRILLLYGSNRECSYSRLLTLEAERLLRYFGAETHVFHPSGLPLPDDAPVTHPKVVELQGYASASGRVARLLHTVQNPPLHEGDPCLTI